MTRLPYYCGVCGRDTTDETPPLHRHIEQVYDVGTDTFWLNLRGQTLTTLTAFAAHQAPEAQIIVDQLPYYPDAVRSHAALRRLVRALRRCLQMPEASVLELLEAACQRLLEGPRA